MKTSQDTELQEAFDILGQLLVRVDVADDIRARLQQAQDRIKSVMAGRGELLRK